MCVDLLEAYERLNRRFVDLAEQQGERIAPVLGRSTCFGEQGEPLYKELWGDRWLSIYQESDNLDPQWNGLIPAHLQVFADVQICSPEVLWKLRCAWFDFRVDVQEADRQVREIVKANDVRENPSI
jgi:hypothetical protein